jgi:hypothetical protein
MTSSGITNFIVSTEDRNSSSMDKFAFEREKNREMYEQEVITDMFSQSGKA